jgi:hypothetical protein
MHPRSNNRDNNQLQLLPLPPPLPSLNNERARVNREWTLDEQTRRNGLEGVHEAKRLLRVVIDSKSRRSSRSPCDAVNDGIGGGCN